MLCLFLGAFVLSLVGRLVVRWPGRRRKDREKSLKVPATQAEEFKKAVQTN